MGGGNRGSRVSYAAGGGSSASISDYTGKPKVAFISFHTADIHQVNLLRQQAKDPRFDMDFTDNSVQRPFDSQWRAQTREKIYRSDVVIVPIGPDTHSREAVEWEIKTAYQMGKPVIGVRIYRDQNHRIPYMMQVNGAPVVNWSMQEISMAMENN